MIFQMIFFPNRMMFGFGKHKLNLFTRECQGIIAFYAFVVITGTYTHLVAKFVFRRRLAYSFIQIYSPTFLIVVLSWLSFWISKEAVPARVALGITTVLTIVTLMGSLRNSVPKVYNEIIDLSPVEQTTVPNRDQGGQKYKNRIKMFTPTSFWYY